MKTLRLKYPSAATEVITTVSLRARSGLAADRKCSFVPRLLSCVLRNLPTWPLLQRRPAVLSHFKGSMMLSVVTGNNFCLAKVQNYGLQYFWKCITKRVTRTIISHRSEATTEIIEVNCFLWLQYFNVYFQHLQFSEKS